MVLECGGVPEGEYALEIQAVQPTGKIEQSTTTVFKISKPEDILRMSFHFWMTVQVKELGMWAIVIRHGDKMLARLPVAIQQGVPGETTMLTT
jgi:hypothetical protein